MSQYDREAFIARMVRVGMSLEGARQIMRDAKKYCRIQEQACNGELTEREKQKEETLEASIIGTCKPYGIVPKFSGDSRGATVRLLMPNRMPSDELGVYVPGS